MSMYPTNTALLERIDDRSAQKTATIGSAHSVQSILSTEQTQVISARNAVSGYHFVMADSQQGCPAWYVVNGHGVPDNTLTSFARHLASSIGMKQAQAQLVPLLSYLNWQTQRGLLWYDPISYLQAAWQDYLRQSASSTKIAGAVTMALNAFTGQGRVLQMLLSMLVQFYTFAIACQTYGYQHPFAGQSRLLWLRCLPLRS